MTKSIRTLEMQGPQGKIKITLEGPIVKHFLSIAQVLEMFLNDQDVHVPDGMFLNGQSSSQKQDNSSTLHQQARRIRQHHSSLAEESNDLKILFDNMTIIDRIKHLIRSGIKMGWANSREIKELYEYHFQTKVSLSTVSTYLKRLSEEGILEKRGSKSNLEYRLNPSWYDQIPELELPRPDSSRTNQQAKNQEAIKAEVKSASKHGTTLVD